MADGLGEGGGGGGGDGGDEYRPDLDAAQLQAHLEEMTVPTIKTEMKRLGIPTARIISERMSTPAIKKAMKLDPVTEGNLMAALANSVGVDPNKPKEKAYAKKRLIDVFLLAKRQRPLPAGTDEPDHPPQPAEVPAILRNFHAQPPALVKADLDMAVKEVQLSVRSSETAVTQCVVKEADVMRLGSVIALENSTKFLEQNSDMRFRNHEQNATTRYLDIKQSAATNFKDLDQSATDRYKALRRSIFNKLRRAESGQPNANRITRLGKRSGAMARKQMAEEGAAESEWTEDDDAAPRAQSIMVRLPSTGLLIQGSTLNDDAPSTSITKTGQLGANKAKKAKK